MSDSRSGIDVAFIKAESVEEPMTSLTQVMRGAERRENYSNHQPLNFASDASSQADDRPQDLATNLRRESELCSRGSAPSERLPRLTENQRSAAICQPQTMGMSPGQGQQVSPLGPMRREQQKRRSKPKEKGCSYVCGVCSDRALGYNFNAITCESCKAFFRRNAVKKKELVCSFDGSCTIDPHSRKFCPACRLKKCFDIGMKREWILTDDQLQKRRVKAQVRRISLANQAGCYSGHPQTDVTMMPTSHRSPPAGSPAAGRMTSFPGQLQHGGSVRSPLPLHAQSSTQNKGYSTDMCGGGEQFLSPTSPVDTKPVFGEGVEFSSSGGAGAHTSHPVDLSSFSHMMPVNGGDTTAGRARGDSPSLYTPPSTPSSSGYSHPLAQHFSVQKTDKSPQLLPSQMPPSKNDKTAFLQLDLEEHAYLGGILKSYKLVFESPIPDQFTEAFQVVNALSDIWNLTDCFIRRLIKFAKHFDEFRSLEQEDQIALLKGGVIELLSLRSVFSFNPQKGDFILDSSKLGPNSIAVDIRKAQSQIPKQIFDQMSQHFHFMQQAMSSTNTDPLTLILLMVIELFSPDRANLSDKKAVSEAQERYSCLLRRYLENKFGFDEAQQMFPKLLILLMQVRDRGKVGSRILENCDVSSLRPLVIEMIGQIGSLGNSGAAGKNDASSRSHGLGSSMNSM